MTPRISVIIPTYNRATLLRDSLESVLAQTLPPAQVIVVNDGSTDDTAKVLRPYLDRIDYIAKENGGKSTALNTALDNTTGDYVWIMDDDDVALPDALHRHISVLEGRPELGFTYSSYCDAVDESDTRLRPGPERPLEELSQAEFLPRLMECNFLPQPAIVVRRGAYRAVGQFDVSLVRCQDFEMLLRLARRFASARVPGPTYIRRRHSGIRGSASAPFPASEMAERYRFYQKSIFSKLRGEVGLEEYVPGKRIETPGDRRRAWLQRMTIMGCHGLYSEMLEDLKLALTAGADGQPLTSAERAMVNRLSHPLHESGVLGDPRFLARLRGLLGGRLGREIRRELLRGLSWMARHAAEHGNAGEVIRIAGVTWKLGGAIDLILSKTGLRVSQK